MEIESKRTSCNLCLNLVQDKCELLDGLLIKTFQMLLFELSSKVTRNLVICQECVEKAKTCLKFKYTIVSAQVNIVAIACLEQNVKQSMKQIYEAYSIDYKINAEQDNNILCTFCLIVISADKAVLLDDPVKVIILKGFPEVDVDMVENLIICMDCWNNFKLFFKFAFNLFQLKRTYFQEVNKGSVTNVDHIQEETYNKPKNSNQYECSVCAYKCNSRSGIIRHIVIHQDGTDIYQCDKCPFRTKHQANLNHHRRFVHGDVPRVFECPVCSFKFKETRTLKKHMIVHQRIATYKCEECSFTTKRKGSLTRHVPVHQKVAKITMYECDKCAYKTKKTSNFKEHVKIHQDVADIAMHRCDKCGYETVRKGTLKRHMLVHEDIANVARYECDECSYRTSRQSNFKRHITKVHQKSPVVAESAVYQCTTCSFTSRIKDSLESHMLLH